MKAILFDFGGTLDTDGIHWSEKLWEIYNLNKVPVTKEEFEKAFVNGEKKLKPLLTQGDGLKSTFNKKVRCEFEYLVENNYLNEIDEDMLSSVVKDCIAVSLVNTNVSKEILGELKEKFKLGVVSNYYGNLDAVLKEVELFELLDLTVDSTVENTYKPDPELYRVAMERINSKPEDTIIVGDSYKNDIDPGKKLGAKTVWLDVQSWTRPASTDSADFIIRTLADLKDIVYKNT